MSRSSLFLWSALFLGGFRCASTSPAFADDHAPDPNTATVDVRQAQALAKNLGYAADFRPFASLPGPLAAVRSYQSAPSPRGWVDLSPDPDVSHHIFLGSKSDASTFPHEMGHVWLYDFKKFVESGSAGVRAVLDWGVLQKWLNIPNGQNEITGPQQERFARGFEHYLMAGKAPSDALAGTFRYYQKKLTELYKSPGRLGPLPPEDVRGVMDRMMVSTERSVEEGP